MSSDSIHAIVSGRVQGVYFRASLRREALQLGLTGFVRNLADGRVEFFAEGPNDVLEHLLRWSRRGPPLAEVTGVELLDSNGDGHFDSFMIR